MLIVSLVLGVFVMSGGRPGRAWLLFGAIFVVSGVDDTIYLYETATHTYTAGTLLDAVWPVCMLLIALVAWQKPSPSRAGEAQGWPALVVASGFALVGLGLLTYDRWHRLNDAALVLATLTLIAVRQVLTNFAANAIKFTSAGDIVLRVTGEPLHGGVQRVRFAVTDTGIGVEPAHVEHIFDAFSQADSSTSRRYGGTGLGLAICRQLVDLMDGKLGVDSEVGVGSTFWFTVPLPAVSAEHARPRPDFDGSRALIFGEYLTSRVILDHQLSAWNMACDTAACLEEATRLLADAAATAQPYALAIIDVRSSAEDGLALARWLRATGGPSTTRLLMLSASGAMRDAAAAAGIDGFLTKPARQLRLVQEIGRLVGGGSGEVLRRTPDAGRQALQPTEYAGRRVLVAEDNMVNQLVAVRMLEQRGFRVDVAANGREAVRMQKAIDYDLIFMDCQMPELDGYAATAEIRQGELPGRHTPIIAMTANTLKGDRERCLAAGMDHYVGKPVRAIDLGTAIACALAIVAHDAPDALTPAPATSVGGAPRGRTRDRRCSTSRCPPTASATTPADSPRW